MIFTVFLHFPHDMSSIFTLHQFFVQVSGSSKIDKNSLHNLSTYSGFEADGPAWVGLKLNAYPVSSRHKFGRIRPFSFLLKKIILAAWDTCLYFVLKFINKNTDATFIAYTLCS